MAIPFLVVIAVVVVLIIASFRIFREYERGVIFLLGRFWQVKGPGLRLVVPVLQQSVKVDLRLITMDVPPQDVISKDNVSVKVSAVLYFRVVDPERVVIQVENYILATSQLAQTTLRSVLGQHDLDEMLSAREKLNNNIQSILDEHTDAWGIKVANVEIKHVDIDESMVRAIARQAEAERERRAKIIHAEGEYQAAAQLVAAAKRIATQPQALQLRYLQTLADISAQGKSVVIPIPLEIFRILGGKESPRVEEPPEPSAMD
ncbi:MAG TPA: slipin family protein [Nitrococcus sp.]|nr:slipin family protein [Nitrococcus sp.]